MADSFWALFVGQATTVVFGTGGTAGFTNGGPSAGSVNVGGVWLMTAPWASGYGSNAELTVSWDGYGVDHSCRRRPPDCCHDSHLKPWCKLFRARRALRTSNCVTTTLAAMTPPTSL